MAYDGPLQVAVISVNLEMTTLIAPAQLIALCLSIAGFYLLGGKRLISYNEHKLIECPDYEV